MADDLPGKLVLPERSDIRDKFLRSVTIRTNGTADVSQGTQPFVDGSSIADAEIPVYANAKAIGDNASLENKSLASLEAYADTIGLVPTHLPATPSDGFVNISASAAGATIVSGQQAKDNSGRVFQCTTTGLYGDGAFVPMVSVSTGPLTNIASGIVLTWVAPPPGLGPTCTVAADASGRGFTGGADEETADALRDRIRDFQENPPAAGNVGAIIALVENIQGLPIQKAFVIPAINGPGTTSILFTIRPDRAGGIRYPNTIQIGQVQSQVTNAFPADDANFVASIIPYPIPLALTVRWAPNATGWQDPQPWPELVPAHIVAVDGGFARTASQVTLLTTSSHADPQVGQTIGFYDKVSKFRRKQILTVTTLSAGLHWTLTFDLSNNASDPDFIPDALAIASPWSDSLDLLVAPLLQGFDGLGPGEQVGSFYDAGLRQRRQPPGPNEWSSEVTGRILVPFYSLSAIDDIQVNGPSLPVETPAGVPGVSSNLLTLSDFGAFTE